MQLIMLAASNIAEANEASPPYRLRKTAPRIAGGIAAKITKTSLESLEKFNNEEAKPAKAGLNINFITITITNANRIFRILGILNISPTVKIAIGVKAADKI